MASCRHCGLTNAIRDNTCIHCGTPFGRFAPCVPEYRGSQGRGGPSSFAELRRRLKTCSQDRGKTRYEIFRRHATTDCTREYVAEVELAGVE
jgi:hypothetical protein